MGSLYKKINLISVFTASTIPSFPLAVPFVYFFDYWVGTKILGMPLMFTLSSFKDFNLRLLGSSVGALFLGAFFVGITLGLLSYFISLSILKFKQR